MIKKKGLFLAALPGLVLLVILTTVHAQRQTSRQDNMGNSDIGQTGTIGGDTGMSIQGQFGQQSWQQQADLNKDGRMDDAEMEQWRVSEQAMTSGADKNKDGRIDDAEMGQWRVSNQGGMNTELSGSAP